MDLHQKYVNMSNWMLFQIVSAVIFMVEVPYQILSFVRVMIRVMKEYVLETLVDHWYVTKTEKLSLLVLQVLQLDNIVLIFLLAMHVSLMSWTGSKRVW